MMNLAVDLQAAYHQAAANSYSFSAVKSVGHSYALKVPNRWAISLRGHNVYKDSWLHPTHFHNVDIS